MCIRDRENGALLLLASATPSTESYYAAQHGRTQLVRLTKRYGGNPLPKMCIRDRTKAEVNGLRAAAAKGRAQTRSASLQSKAAAAHRALGAAGGTLGAQQLKGGNHACTGVGSVADHILSLIHI